MAVIAIVAGKFAESFDAEDDNFVSHVLPLCCCYVSHYTYLSAFVNRYHDLILKKGGNYLFKYLGRDSPRNGRGGSNTTTKKYIILSYLNSSDWPPFHQSETNT